MAASLLAYPRDSLLALNASWRRGWSGTAPTRPELSLGVYLQRSALVAPTVASAPAPDMQQAPGRVPVSIQAAPHGAPSPTPAPVPVAVPAAAPVQAVPVPIKIPGNSRHRQGNLQRGGTGERHGRGRQEASGAAGAAVAVLHGGRMLTVDDVHHHRGGVCNEGEEGGRREMSMALQVPQVAKSKSTLIASGRTEKN